MRDCIVNYQLKKIAPTCVEMYICRDYIREYIIWKILGEMGAGNWNNIEVYAQWIVRVVKMERKAGDVWEKEERTHAFSSTTRATLWS